MVIPRHVSPTDQHRDSLKHEAEMLEKTLALARIESSKLHSVYRYAVATAQLGSVVDVHSPLVPRGLSLAGEAITANFRLQRGQGRIKKVRLDGNQVAYGTGTPARDYLTPADWLKGFCLAMICRDTELLDELCRISGADLQRLDAADAEYRFLLVDGIRQTWQGEDPSDALVAAMEATDPQREDVQTHADLARVKRLDVPFIQLVWYVASGDADFDKVLAQALRTHREYWTGDDERTRSRHGFLSIELTAAAAWYLDWERGAVAVESDYIPERLVTGDFL
jgi:hypothetical protein